ncbi:MAG: SPFH domain-containing protein [Candidatus Thermoplasmatota archaeon]|jgi:regulator of protease activity HflC (stomatin/prohibitin superfamily)|nr:SPFH domain-containing protein [Candidatus Thermoplasmatota archaeon]MCL5800005.1 SPFH domain-containing protein [Candidatus Thermoplasmatota archaeon]
MDATYYYLGGFLLFIVIIILLSGIHVLKEWERAVVLTLGRYGGIKGPGIIFVTPIVSKITKISTRIQVVAFKSEASFTKDNVPVNIDAVMYYQVVDAQKAVLNIESYYNGTNLSAQTTIREVIGKYSFDEVLSEREKIAVSAREIIDEKTEHWGVKVSGVEIRDVQVPQSLQEAMSRQASAERERRSRVTLAIAEVEASQKMSEASNQYLNNPIAFQLRWMNILYEIGLEGKGSLMMIPMQVAAAADINALSALGLKSVAQANKSASGDRSATSQQPGTQQ